MKKIVSLLLLTTGFSLQSAEQNVLERSASPALDRLDSPEFSHSTCKDSIIADLRNLIERQERRLADLEQHVALLPRSHRGIFNEIVAGAVEVGVNALEETAGEPLQNGADIKNILVQVATAQKMTLEEAGRLAAALIENEVLISALKAAFKAGKKACCIRFCGNTKKQSAALAHTTAQTVLSHALLGNSSSATETSVVPATNSVVDASAGISTPAAVNPAVAAAAATRGRRSATTAC